MNKITYGLERVHVAFINNPNATPPTWHDPIAVPGAVRFTPTPQGQEVKFYADNTLYHATITNDGYTAELEMALVPDEILAEMLGWMVDDKNTLVEVTDGVEKEFALLGQVQGDEKNRRFVYYRCKASRPAKEQKTQSETIEPNTDVLSLIIMPEMLNISGEERRVIKGTMELDDDVMSDTYNGGEAGEYATFFDAVYLPEVTPPAAPTVVSAETNVEGTVITVEFSKAMADPTGKHAEFTFNDGDARTFSAAALDADTTKIDLTVSGTAIANGATVTMSYTEGTVLAADDGILATFADQSVTNNVSA